MKPIVKQKLSTLQDIINKAQAGGGGGTVDAYTKAEADAKFETIADAASTYLSKTDAANMVNKISVSGTISNNKLQFTFSVADVNLLDNCIIILKVLTELIPSITPLFLCIFLVDGNLQAFNINGEYESSVIVLFANQTLTLSLDLDNYQYVVSGDATLIY